MKRRLLSLVLLFLLGFFLFNPTLILEAAKAGLDTWVATVVPALFPFFVLNSLLLAYGIIDYLARPFEPLTMRCFHLPGEAAFVLICGFTSGSPVSAALVGDLCRHGKLTDDQGQRLLALSANASPMFILSVAAISFLQRPDLGFTLLAVVYGSNLLLGILWGFFNKNPKEGKNAKAEEMKKIPPTGKALIDAVFHAMSALGLIGGLMIVFFIVIAIVDGLPIGRGLAFLLPGFGETDTAPLISGTLEMTAGLAALPATTLSIRIKFMLAAGILAFSGLCIHMQIAGQIMETNLSVQKFAVYKCLQAAAAMGIAYFVPIPEAAMALPLPPQTATVSLRLWLGPYGLLLAASLAAAWIILHCVPERVHKRLRRR